MEQNVLKLLVDLLYPRRCPLCGDIVTPRGELACPPCKKKQKVIIEPRCKKCSKPIESDELEYCYDCERKQQHFMEGIALWEYDEIMKNSISNFKFNGKKEYGDFYIEEFLNNHGSKVLKISPDVLAPIPIHKSKLAGRGYNQAEILAEGIGKELNIPILPHLLLRNKKTLPQKQLNDKERLKNLEKAFLFSQKEREKFKKPINKVMLIDDIYTTGSTIEACTKILMQNGIEEVYFASICIGKGF
jgi:ComF family protein